MLSAMPPTLKRDCAKARDVETGYSNQKSIELAKHLDHLKILDKERPRSKSSRSGVLGDMRSLAEMFGPKTSGEYEKFLEELYDKKKKVIERELGL